MLQKRKKFCKGTKLFSFPKQSPQNKSGGNFSATSFSATSDQWVVMANSFF
jgi:hypothetical protein